MAHDKLYGVCENKCLVPIAHISDFRVFTLPCMFDTEATIQEKTIGFGQLELPEFENVAVFAQSAINDIFVAVPIFDTNSVTLEFRSLTGTAFDYAEVNLFVVGLGRTDLL